MAVLILGATGLAGACLRAKLSATGEDVYGTCRNPGRDGRLRRLDLEEGGLERILEEIRPDTVISCLRGDFERQLILHRMVAEDLAGRGGRMVFLSTANVFDGERNRPHYEDDTPCAESTYGQFKAACERMLQGKLGKNLAVLRLPEIWGQNAPRMVDLRQADQDGTAVCVYKNVSINFTTDRQVAEWAAYILEKGLYGIFHTGTRDECTHGAFRMRLAGRLGLRNIQWEEDSLVGCQSVLPGRPEIPERLQDTVDGVLQWLAE